jgi:hypothetical protein
MEPDLQRTESAKEPTNIAEKVDFVNGSLNKMVVLKNG